MRLILRGALFVMPLLTIGYTQSSTNFGAHRFPAHDADSRLLLQVPTPVQGVKVRIISEKLQLLQISWSSSPNYEKIDDFAIYTRDGLKPDGASGVLVQTTKQTTNTLHYYFPSVSLARKSNDVAVTAGVSQLFWVVAHNRRGWGENEYNSGNPDGSAALKLSLADASILAPTIYYLDIPCRSELEKLHVCA